MRAVVTAVMVAGLLGGAALTGCSRGQVAGAAAAGAVGGGIYEYSNKEALEDLRKDYQKGKISKEEYERRKKDIEKRSLVY